MKKQTENGREEASRLWQNVSLETILKLYSSLPLRLKNAERRKYHLSIFLNNYFYFEPKFIILVIKMAFVKIQTIHKIYTSVVYTLKATHILQTNDRKKVYERYKEKREKR